MYDFAFLLSQVQALNSTTPQLFLLIITYCQLVVALLLHHQQSSSAVFYGFKQRVSIVCIISLHERTIRCSGFIFVMSFGVYTIYVYRIPAARQVMSS